MKNSLLSRGKFRNVLIFHTETTLQQKLIMIHVIHFESLAAGRRDFERLFFAAEDSLDHEEEDWHPMPNCNRTTDQDSEIGHVVAVPGKW